MSLTTDEKERIRIIKRDFPTRNKWSKQDYSDFYFRDITMLLKVIERFSQQTHPTDLNTGG